MAFQYDKEIIDWSNMTSNTPINTEGKYLLRPCDIVNSFGSQNFSFNNQDIINNSSNQSDSEYTPSDDYESDITDSESDSEENDSWQKIAIKRMDEITRKEDIIVKKDQKATRLIGIIREKNNEINSLKKKNLDQQRLIWKLYKQAHSTSADAASKLIESS